MAVTRFDPSSDLLVVRAVAVGPRGARARLDVAVDTGASVTVIAPYVLDRLGYSARQGDAITKLRSAIGEEPGYLIRVNQFRTLGHQCRS